MDVHLQVSLVGFKIYIAFIYFHTVPRIETEHATVFLSQRAIDLGREAG